MNNDGVFKGPYAFISYSDGADKITIMREDDEEGKTRSKRIAGCVTGCLGIVDPDKTVPELVDVIRTLVEGDHDEGCEFWGGPDCACTCIPARARALLAKTGQKPSGPPAQPDAASVTESAG